MHVIAFFHQDLLDRGGNRGVGLEVLNRLHFSVGGNQAADGPALNFGHVYFERRLVRVRVNDVENDEDGKAQPDPPSPGRCSRIVRQRQPVVFQGETRITVTSNLPSGSTPWHVRLRLCFWCRLPAAASRYAGYNESCPSRPATHPLTQLPVSTPSFLRLRSGPTSFRDTKSSSTIRSLLQCARRPACPTSASSPSATCLAKHCLELKSLKEYLQSYRNLGIFQENVVNRVLDDVVKWAQPVWAEVTGEFRPRGGISTTIVARWPRPKGRK